MRHSGRNFSQEDTEMASERTEVSYPIRAQGDAEQSCCAAPAHTRWEGHQAGAPWLQQVGDLRAVDRARLDHGATPLSKFTKNHGIMHVHGVCGT